MNNEVMLRRDFSIAKWKVLWSPKNILFLSELNHRKTRHNFFSWKKNFKSPCCCVRCVWLLFFKSVYYFTSVYIVFWFVARVVMTVYFTTIIEGYHLKIKLLKKSRNFYFPANCNIWGRSIKIHDKIVKLVHNAQKNRYIRTHFSFFLATPFLLSYPLQSFGGKFKIVNFL